MVAAISVSISGTNQSASGTKPKAAAISEIECASVNEVTRITSGLQPPEGENEAEQEQEVVDALQDVPEPRDAEAPGRLMPARVEPHEARVAVELERPHGAVRRQEAQGRLDPLGEAVDARVDREGGAVRPDRVFEQHVEELLVPVEVEVVGEAAGPARGPGPRS